MDSPVKMCCGQPGPEEAVVRPNLSLYKLRISILIIKILLDNGWCS